MGLLAGLAGLMWATNYESVNSANAGILIELDVIAAVVIGGTRMEGGRGSILGTVIGVLLIGVIRNMLVMFEVTSHAHGLVLGLIIIAAVLVQQLGTRRRES
jgi:ribose transport system permease protein